MPLVNEHQRANEPKDVAKTLLHGQAANTKPFLGQIGGIEIGHLPEKCLVRDGVVHFRKKTGKLAAVLKHLARLFARFLHRARLEHHQHHAKLFLHVLLCEAVAFFQQPHAATGGAFQHLPVGMFPVGERFPRLRINRLRRHDPQHKTGLLLEILGIDPLDGHRAEQRLAATGGNFQADIRHGTFQSIFAGDVLRRGGVAVLVLCQWQCLLDMEEIPRLPAIIVQLGIAAFAALKFEDFFRLLAADYECLQIPAQALQHVFLVIL